jgi:hypothetical protein
MCDMRRETITSEGFRLKNKTEEPVRYTRSTHIGKQIA